MKQDTHSTETQKATAVLIGVINKKQNETLAYEYLDELAFLAET